MFTVTLGKNPPFIITKEALDIIKSQLERERIEKALKSSNDDERKTTLLFGLTFEEILKKIYPSPKEEIKMTREEAKYKILGIFDSKSSTRNVDDFIDGLEALGLLKFEEEKDKVDNVIKEAKEVITMHHSYKTMADFQRLVTKLIAIIENKK